MAWAPPTVSILISGGACKRGADSGYWAQVAGLGFVVLFVLRC